MRERTIDDRFEAVPPARYRGSGDIARAIFEFAATHPIVLVSHVMKLFELDRRAAEGHLDGLLARGFLRRGPRLRHQLGAYQVTVTGLREIGSDLPAPIIDLRRYWRDIGVTWLSIAARGGVFGDVDRIYTRREMRCRR
jgi:hypothetical protein